MYELLYVLFISTFIRPGFLIFSSTAVTTSKLAFKISVFPKYLIALQKLFYVHVNTRNKWIQSVLFKLAYKNLHSYVSLHLRTFFFVRNPSNITIQFLFHTLLYCHSSVLGALKAPTVANKFYNLYWYYIRILIAFNFKWEIRTVSLGEELYKIGFWIYVKNK